MQQFTVKLTGIEKGIVPFEYSSALGGLADCFGVMPKMGALVSFEKPKNPLGVEMGFPFPQLLLTHVPILAYENRLDILDLDFSVILRSLSVPAGGLWHVADCGQYAVLTNGACVVEVSPEGFLSISSSLPQFSTVCFFRGQLFGGGFFSPHNGLGRNGFAWSKIGRPDFTIDKSNSAGMGAFGPSEEVLGCHALEDGVLVFTSNRVFRFFPVEEPVPGFGKNELAIPGCMSRNSFCGDHEVCFLLDQHGALWRVASVGKKDEGVKKLLGREFFASFRGQSPVLTYNKEFSSVDISTKTKALRVTEEGVCRSPVAISSQYSRFETTIGTFSVVDDTEGFFVKTNPVNFGIVGLKTLTAIFVQGDFDEALFAKVRWRIKNSSALFETAPIRLNDEGFGFVRVTGDEFSVEVFSRGNEKVKLSSIGVSYQLCDGRTRRGIMNADTAVTGADS